MTRGVLHHRCVACASVFLTTCCVVRLLMAAQVQSLERIELELIERLRQTQLAQQRAYEELEHTLKDPQSTSTSKGSGTPS